MSMIEKKKQNRRELLCRAGRGIALAGLAGIGGWALKKKMASGSQEKCINHSICRGCGVVDECYLPQALSFKQVTKRK